MADPVTMAIVGATAGAALNPDKPLKGAVIGGTLGYGGGSLMAGAGGAAGYGALPGMTAGSEQAAMLAAQTGEFGMPGLLSTGAAASSAQGISPMTASLFNFGSNAMLPGPNQMSGMGAMQQSQFANQLFARNQQAQQRLPGAPQIQSRPYTGMKNTINPQEEEMRRRMMYAMPQVQPIRLI